MTSRGRTEGKAEDAVVSKVGNEVSPSQTSVDAASTECSSSAFVSVEDVDVGTVDISAMGPSAPVSPSFACISAACDASYSGSQSPSASASECSALTVVDVSESYSCSTAGQS